jgi:hypothetical protein
MACPLISSISFVPVSNPSKQQLLTPLSLMLTNTPVDEQIGHWNMIDKAQ